MGFSTGEPAAHALARCRCFLPDLAGLAGLRRAGPGAIDSNIELGIAKIAISARIAII
jgi:hypothetical protein